MTPETEDPIVAEVRAVREELSARFGEDIEALCDFLQTLEVEHADRLVNRPPQRAIPLATRKSF